MRMKTTFGQESHKIDYSSYETLEEYRAKLIKKFSSQLPSNFVIAYKKNKDPTSRFVKTEQDFILMQNSDPISIEIVKPNDSTEESSSDSDSTPYINSCLEIQPDKGLQLESDDEDIEALLEIQKPNFHYLSVASISSDEPEEDNDIQEIVVSKVAARAQTAQKAQTPANLQNKKDQNVETKEAMQEMTTKKNKKRKEDMKPQPQVRNEKVEQEPKSKKVQKIQETTQNHQEQNGPPTIDEEAKKGIRATVLGDLSSSFISEAFLKFGKEQEFSRKTSQEFQKKQFEAQSSALNDLKLELTSLQNSQKEHSKKINNIIAVLQDLQTSTQQQKSSQQDTLNKILEILVKPEQTPPNSSPSGPSQSQSKKQEESKTPNDDNNPKPKEEKKKRKFAEKRKKSPSSSPISSSDSSESNEEKAKRKSKKKAATSSESSGSSSDSESESPKRKPKNQKQSKNHHEKWSAADNFFKRASENKDKPSSIFGKPPNRSDNGKQKNSNYFHPQDEKVNQKPEVHYRVEYEEGGTNPERIFPYAARLYKSVLLKNTGQTPWPATCKLIYKEGVKGVEGQTQAKAPSVKPGELVPITLELEGPGEPGRYSSVWKLSFTSNRGKTEEFGEPIRVYFNVVDPKERSDSDIDEEHHLEVSQDGDDLENFADNQSDIALAWESEKEKNDMIKNVVSILDDSARPEIEELVSLHHKRTRDEYIDMYFKNRILDKNLP